MSVTIDLVATTLIPEFEVDELEGFFLLRWKNPPPFTDDELLEMFALNEGLQFEVDCDGSLIIMSPSGLKSGFRTMQLTTQLGVWANRDGTGPRQGRRFRRAVVAFVLEDGVDVVDRGLAHRRAGRRPRRPRPHRHDRHVTRIRFVMNRRDKRTSGSESVAPSSRPPRKLVLACLRGCG